MSHVYVLYQWGGWGGGVVSEEGVSIIFRRQGRAEADCLVDNNNLDL